MIRTVLMAFIVAALGHAAPTAAQGPPPDNDDSRYTFHRADDSYLRLDGRTGQVAFCTRRSVGWACQLVPDERTALESEIARLQNEGATLKRELLSRNLPLPGAVRPDMPQGKIEEPRLQLPSDAEINRVMTFIEKVWRRLVEMIAGVQKDFMRKT